MSRLNTLCENYSKLLRLVVVPLVGELPMKLTEIVVKQALETVRYLDVKSWSNEVFGQSMFSKRKTLFANQANDRKTV